MGFGVTWGTSIVHRPQGIIVVELLCASSLAGQTAAPRIPIAKYSAEWEGHGHVVLNAITGDAVLRDLDVCHLTKFLKFVCLPIVDLFASFLRRTTARSHCEPQFTRGVLGGFSQEMTFQYPDLCQPNELLKFFRHPRR